MALGDDAPPRRVNLDGLYSLLWSFGAAEPAAAQRACAARVTQS
jgi:hypothetical protein